MKRIAITQRVIKTKKGIFIDALEQEYIQYYQTFGILLFPIPNTLNSVSEYLDSLSINGVILSGGNDIDPLLYGEKRNSKTKYFKEKDKTDIEIIKWCLDNNIPILAECRGAQILVVYFGGKLSKVTDHVNKTHKITLYDSKKIHFTNKHRNVNSFHNYGLYAESLPEYLVPFAIADDNTIEGFYHKNLKLAGIMWHPERSSPDEELNKLIVTAFTQNDGFWK